MAEINTSTKVPVESGLSGNLRPVDVVDLVIADGEYYKPAILRSYARFCYMPSGETLLSYLLDMNEEMKKLQDRVIKLERFTSLEFSRALAELETKVLKAEQAGEDAVRTFHMWTNPNTTVAFNNTSPKSGCYVVNFPTDDYDALDIYYYGDVGNGTMRSIRILKGKNGKLLVATVGQNGGTLKPTIWERRIRYVSSSRYDFGDAICVGDPPNGGNTQCACIPYRIMGVKF